MGQSQIEIIHLYNQLAEEIVSRQKEIIGPLAITQAKTVKGVSISGSDVVILDGFDAKKVIENLVKAYSNVFGKVSVEVCKDAVNEIGLTDKSFLPDILI
jgi:hypothetical protein